MRRLKILDFYVHQGNQHSHFKLNHDFFLADIKPKLIPKWNKDHRPLNSNVKLVSEVSVRNNKFDIIMVRSPIHIKRVKPFIDRGAIPIAVVQTSQPGRIPQECKHVVWNSHYSMKKYQHRLSGKNHYYIVHGYDPNEFKPLKDTKKNGRVLTVANVFKRRGDIMGYPLWLRVSRGIKKLDVIGHGNLDMYRKDRQAKTFKGLVKTYNTYDVYFNPTQSSAMPRSRAEAAMCGLPIVSTDNFGIGRYFAHKKNAFLSNDHKQIVHAINNLLNSEQMRIDYGMAARETAIKYFHIKDYIEKWERLFKRL